MWAAAGAEVYEEFLAAVFRDVLVNRGSLWSRTKSRFSKTGSTMRAVPADFWQEQHSYQRSRGRLWALRAWAALLRKAPEGIHHMSPTR